MSESRKAAFSLQLDARPPWVDEDGEIIDELLPDEEQREPDDDPTTPDEIVDRIIDQLNLNRAELERDRNGDEIIPLTRDALRDLVRDTRDSALHEVRRETTPTARSSVEIERAARQILDIEIESITPVSVNDVYVYRLTLALCGGLSGAFLKYQDECLVEPKQFGEGWLGRAMVRVYSDGPFTFEVDESPPQEFRRSAKVTVRQDMWGGNVYDVDVETSHYTVQAFECLGQRTGRIAETVQFSGDTLRSIRYPFANGLIVRGHGRFFNARGEEIAAPTRQGNSFVSSAPTWGSFSVEYQAPYTLYQVNFGLRADDAERNKRDWFMGKPCSFSPVTCYAFGAGGSANARINRRVFPERAEFEPANRRDEWKDEERTRINQDVVQKTITDPNNPNNYIKVETPTRLVFEGPDGKRLTMNLPEAQA